MSEFVEIKTAELAGAALDWAVAKVDGADDLKVTDSGSVCCIYEMPCGSGCWTNYYEPSTDWAYGGHLIGKYKVNLHSPQHSDDCWAAWITIRGKDFTKGAYQPLQAACRAIVASVLGETVSVPKELT